MYCTYETINLINGKYYRGYCSDHSRIEDNKYRGSGLLLHRAIRKYGWDSFVTSVVKTFDTNTEAYKHEKLFVVRNIDDPLSYNLNGGGYGNWSAAHTAAIGTIAIHNPETNDRKFVTSDDLTNFLHCGYIYGFGQYGQREDTWIRIYHPETNDNRFVTLNDANQYFSKGYIRGQSYPSSTKSKVAIYHVVEKIKKYVAEDELSSYLDNGYIIGQNHFPAKGKHWVHNKMTNVRKYVLSKDIPAYLDKGFELGMGKTNFLRKYYVNKNNKTKRIAKSEIQDYLADGYVRGKSNDCKTTSNKRWVHNQLTKDRKYIDAYLVDTYLNKGYKRGTGPQNKK